MLGSDGTQLVIAGSTREADVVNLVGISLLLVLLNAGSAVEDVDVVIVGHVDGSELGHVGGDGDALESSGSLVEDGTLLLLSSDGVPSEDQGDGSTLSSDGERAIGRHGEGHDVVVVTVHLTSGLSSGVISLTTTEEFLSVRFSVEDDSEGGSHVGDLVVLVEVDVLARVLRSVSVAVLKSVGLVGLISVSFVVLFGLGNLTDPRLDSHELLALSLFSFEEAFVFGGVLSTVLGSDVVTRFIVIAFGRIAGVSCA